MKFVRLHYKISTSKDSNDGYKIKENLDNDLEAKYLTKKLA